MSGKYIKKIWLLSTCLLMISGYANICSALAGDSLGLDYVSGNAPINSIDKDQALGNVITWLLGITGSLALLAIVVGGFMYVGSLGDDSKTKKAKHIIMWAIIGLSVIILSYVILNTVLNFVGAGRTCIPGQPGCGT